MALGNITVTLRFLDEPKVKQILAELRDLIDCSIPDQTPPCYTRPEGLCRTHALSELERAQKDLESEEKAHAETRRELKERSGP